MGFNRTRARSEAFNRYSNGLRKISSFFEVLTTRINWVNEKNDIALINELKGNPVKIGSGPAAVIGDNIRVNATVHVSNGKVRMTG